MNTKLDMILKDVLKDEILKTNKHVFRICHFIAAIDFKAEYNIMKIDIPENKSFTLNQVKKLIPNIKDCNAVCFIPSFDNNYYSDYIFTLDTSKKLDIDINYKDFYNARNRYNYYVNIESRHITDISMKKTFDNIRKKCNTVYIIYQLKTLLKPGYDSTVDKSDRINYKGYYCIQNNKMFKNSSAYYNRYKINRTDIDKSGYYIDPLKYSDKLRTYKAEKSKKRIDSINLDFTIIDIRNNIEYVKNYIIDNIDDSEKLTDNILTGYNHMLRLFSKYQFLYLNHDFRDEKQAINIYNTIDTCYKSILTDIQDLNN